MCVPAKDEQSATEENSGVQVPWKAALFQNKPETQASMIREHVRHSVAQGPVAVKHSWGRMCLNASAMLTMSGCSRCSGRGHQQGRTCWQAAPYNPHVRTSSRWGHHTCWCGRNLPEGRRLRSRARTMCWTLSKNTRRQAGNVQSYCRLHSSA